MTEDELSAVRRRFPVGTRIRGTVSGYPAGVGRAGVTVDLGDAVPGWVDMLLLPMDPGQWPAVGRKGLFEVLQHRGFEIRLFPLDAGMRGPGCRQLPWSGAQWAAITRQYPVGTVVEAQVLHVFSGNREYTVQFADGCRATVEYDGPAPVSGALVMLTVERLQEWTQRLILRPPP